MFTGIVEELGELAAVDWHGPAGTVTVRGPLVASDLRPGDSLAVSGVCLTVVAVGDGSPEGAAGMTEGGAGIVTADVMKETVDRSALGTLTPGDPVNLERAATLATRLGGHLVQGHVDGVGTILARTPGERWEDVRVALPPGLARYVVEKGSIAVDGVSLTVVAVDSGGGGAGGESAWFDVSLVPTTLARTTFGRRALGDLVNIEVDVIAKYVEKQVAGVAGP